MSENIFIWNLQKEYLNQKVKNPLLWSYETSKGGWSRLFTEYLQGEHYISSDWSKFDKFALHEVIDDIHDMWRSWFDFDQGYEPTEADPDAPARLSYPDSQSSERRIQNLWDWMCYSIKHTPIRGFSGKFYQWQFNGIASGFQQTQLLDSFYNCVMTLTCLSALGIDIELPSFSAKFQGDDSFIKWLQATLGICRTKEEFLARYAEEAKIRFNAVLSEKKTQYSTNINDISVLSYGHTNGIAHRDELELLAHLLYPERDQNLAATAASAVGIALASMGSSRRVYDICKNVHQFISNRHVPRFTANQEYRLARREIYVDPTIFPTFEECYAQNFVIGGRTQAEKNRLWPTEPTGRYNFRFLLD